MRDRGATLALAALLLGQLGSVRATNFWGHDEWLLQHLISIGVIDVPYANRPLALLWEMPIAWLMPDDFRAWTLCYAAYAFAAALLLRGLCRHLVPTRPLLAWSAPALFLVWAPSDPFRLACFERTQYMAISFGTLLAAWLFVRAWQRHSPAILATGILASFVTVRCYEATLPVLMAWPLGVAWMLRERSREFARWSAAWWAFGSLAALLVAMPNLLPTSPSYQQRLGLDPEPWRIVGRLATQFWLHLAPLFAPTLRELATPAVAVSTLAVLAGAGLAGTVGPAKARGIEIRGMLFGLMLAAASYLFFTLSSREEVGAWRKQFIAGPWIAVFLGSAVSLLSSWTRERWRVAVQALLVSGIVAVGTARTLYMQSVWDQTSYYAIQVSFLRGLTQAVPDVRPHTLFVLLDSGGVWRSAFGFRLASRYLYGGRAVGWAYGTAPVMFPSQFTTAGVVCEPWHDVQRAWREPPTLHRFEEIVVVRHGADGRVEVAPTWPLELPPLPPSARYEPRARILDTPGAYRSRAIFNSIASPESLAPPISWDEAVARRPKS